MGSRVNPPDARRLLRGGRVRSIAACRAAGDHGNRGHHARERRSQRGACQGSTDRRSVNPALLENLRRQPPQALVEAVTISTRNAHRTRARRRRHDQCACAVGMRELAPRPAGRRDRGSSRSRRMGSSVWPPAGSAAGALPTTRGSSSSSEVSLSARSQLRPPLCHRLC